MRLTIRKKRSLMVFSAPLVILVLTGLFVFSTGCDLFEEEEKSSNPVGTLTSFMGCKSTRMIERTGHMSSDDCILWSYGNNTLFLTHLNACFNCCPGQIYASIGINDNHILIREREAQAACDCLCLFDLDYRITDLPSGSYVLEIEEPYVKYSALDPLIMTLTLRDGSSGEFCITREEYPWN